MASDDRPLAKRISRLEAENLVLRGRLHEAELLRERAQLEQEDRSHAHGSLQSAVARYVDLYDFAPIPYLTLGANGLLREANLTTAQLLGTERSLLVGRQLLSFVASLDRRRFLEHMRRCRAGEAPVRTELCLESTKGVLPVELMSRPARYSAEPEFRTVVLDLSERIALEAERRRMQEEALELELRAERARASSEAKDRFLAMLSHELRTPLTPIVAALDLLEMHLDSPEQMLKFSRFVRRNVEAEVRLVDDLLDVTRVIRGKLNLVREKVDLEALVAEVFEDAASEASARGVTLDVQLAVRRARIDADPYRIKQVVRNLLNNALKFGETGKQIVARIDAPRPGWIRFEIADQGVGLTRDQLARIFLPFEQMEAGLSRRGLGLGLAICKGIVEAHGGSIRAYSAGRGRGAQFTFEIESVRDVLEQVSRDPSQRPSLRNAPPRSPGTKHLLLVEDDADTAEALGALLQEHGYRVRVATTVASALEQAREGCDLLVSDLKLPDGSGHALLEQLPSGLPAIALSGYGKIEDVQRSRECGFLDHLVKPISTARLLNAIERALALPSGSGERV